MTAPTAPIQLVQAATAFGKRAGLDVNGILAAAGVSPMLLVEGRSRVTEEQITRIVQELWRSADDEMFGLGSHPLPRGSFRLVSYALLSAGDLGGVVTRADGFIRAVPALSGLGFQAADESIRVTVTMSAEQDPDGLATTLGLVVLHRFLSWLIGRPIALSRVDLPQDGGLGAETYRLLFGTDVHLGAHSAALEFPSDLQSSPIVRKENELEEFVASSPAGLLSRPEHDATVADQVRSLLEQGFKAQDWPSADAIARRLSMSAQTMRRRLRDEDASLRDIKEDLLRDAAVTSLVRGDESVAALSGRLGFSEPSAFTRAFRRWTGSTPGAYRKDAG